MRWLLLSALLLASPAGAQSSASDAAEQDVRYVYVYVDNDGQIHFVDRLELVPQAFRNRAHKSQLNTTADDREEALRAAAKKRAAKRAAEAKAAAKEEAQARIDARDARDAEPAPDPEPKEPSAELKRADLLAERVAVLEELALLEEGWAGDDDQPEVALLERLNFLEKRLTELDAALK